jgi:mannose-1-phosphate guanylyltransferase
MKFIITAGGTGTKMWPLSKENRPKQFQKIIADKSLYKYQVETLLKRFPLHDIYVSTKEQYVPLVLEDTPDLPAENIIIEPNFKKNRGPGEGYAILKLSVLFPDEPFMIIQSDDLRVPEDRFLDMIETMEKLVRRDKKFISSGQKAIYPDMGSDYLQLGQRLSFEGDIEIYNVDKFVYRLGDYQKTKDLIENFHVSTHTNHNCWYPELMLEAYKEFKPEWYAALMQIRDTFGKANEKELTEKIYAEMEEGPTEEVTKHVFERGYIILNPFKWMDFGTWDSMYEHLATPGEVYADGDVISVQSRNTLVKGRAGKIIATLGVDNLVIVDTEDALLVCAKDRTGDIKLVLDELKKRGLNQYL